MLRERERVEHRVLGALRCTDATTLVPLDTPLTLTGNGVELLHNRSGLYVIWEWTQLATHAPAFDSPPPAPALGSEPLELSVQDPSGRYLPRRVRIALPRDPLPANTANAQSLFRPIDVPMYASPSAKVGANWVVLRVNVRETATRDALGGALLRVVSKGTVLARGLTDWRGEALVPVAAVPVTTWSTEPGAVTITEIAASIEAVFDPGAGRRTPEAIVLSGANKVAQPVVDPDAIETARAGLPQVAAVVSLAAGRSLSVSLQITAP
jgi:hypothetical protein